MGNYQVSCISSLSTAIRSSSIKPSITIVNVNGRACQVEEPLTVGELMLELPGQCVVELSAHTQYMRPVDMIMADKSSGKKSRRIVALSADSNLRAHHIYFVLPLKRIETRLSLDELQVLITVATRLARNSVSAHMHTSKITPLSSCQCGDATLQGLSGNIGELLEGSEGKVQQEEEEIGKSGGSCLHSQYKTRSWTPKLDTIAEIETWWDSHMSGVHIS